MGPEAETRFPKRGEGWRHHKGTLYEIVGTGYDEATGSSVVIYMDYQWGFTQAPALWSRTLEVFMGMTDDRKRRFRFEREPAKIEMSIAEVTPIDDMLAALSDADKLYTGYGLVAEKSVDGVSPGEWIGRVRNILRANHRK